LLGEDAFLFRDVDLPLRSIDSRVYLVREIRHGKSVWLSARRDRGRVI
jgi:hypothetical protein